MLGARRVLYLITAACALMVYACTRNTGGRFEEELANLSPAVNPADMQAEVSFLASDNLEGRMTGTAGTKTAAEYIAAYFEKYGLQPVPGGKGYFHEFQFTSGVNVIPEETALTITTGGETQTFALDRDFRPLAFSASGEAEAEVVFAGYGLVVPGEGEKAYDSYANLDVEGKIVLVLRYAPEDVEMQRRQELNMFAGLRYKAMLARERGAMALLVLTGPNSPGAGELVALAFDQSLASSGILALSISDAVARALFAGAGKDLQKIQKALDREDPHAETGFALPKVHAKLTVSIKQEKKPDRNVVAYLPAADASATKEEFVMLGAHYDHIGRGEIGSLARKGEEGQVHNGADDNASGTSLVLELAASLAEKRRQNPDQFARGVMFALWSGEELGIVGSSYFAGHPPVPLERAVAYVNFDMVGRLRENKLILQGLGSSPYWKALIEAQKDQTDLQLTLQDDPYQPTDVTAFYPKGVPVLGFFTGSHEDYNRPTDDPETLNFEGMQTIAAFAEKVVLDLVEAKERPAYTKVEMQRSRRGRPGGRRAYLGTIPDFAAQDIEGVKLSGVKAGGPADRGGVQGGDIIIEFGGQKIANIYDYTYALQAVKIGEPVKVVVLRGGERVALTIVPEIRK